MTGVTATDCCDGRIAATDHDDADTAPWCPEPGGHNNTGREVSQFGAIFMGK